MKCWLEFPLQLWPNSFSVQKNSLKAFVCVYYPRFLCVHFLLNPLGPHSPSISPAMLLHPVVDMQAASHVTGSAAFVQYNPSFTAPWSTCSLWLQDTTIPWCHSTSLAIYLNCSSPFPTGVRRVQCLDFTSSPAILTIWISSALPIM